MLFIMRHGRTDWNDCHRLQGRTDIPLNENGIRMAKEAAVRYADQTFDICFCSPLSRAKQTAEILLENRNIPIRYDDRLQEMSFGEYEGLANSFQISDCPINVLFQHPEQYHGAGNAETFEQLFARTGAFLEEVVEPLLQEGKNVLIVGHGAMNNSIVSQVRGLSIDQFWTTAIPNCELIQLK